jgi:hypothetical protein
MNLIFNILNNEYLINNYYDISYLSTSILYNTTNHREINNKLLGKARTRSRLERSRREVRLSSPDHNYMYIYYNIYTTSSRGWAERVPPCNAFPPTRVPGGVPAVTRSRRCHGSIYIILLLGVGVNAFPPKTRSRRNPFPAEPVPAGTRSRRPPSGERFKYSSFLTYSWMKYLIR